MNKEREARSMKQKCDVLIIGGGIVGASIAYYVSKTGLDVQVVEKKEIAAGTSSKCDGNILAIDKDPGFDSLMSMESQQLVSDLSKTLPEKFEYRNPGSILVCETEEEMKAAQQWVDQQKQHNLPFRMLDKEDLRNESKYFADDLLGGLECASDATVNPYLFTYALMNGAKSQGASLSTHTTVTSIKKVNDAYQVETDKGTIKTKRIVNAAGIWAPHITHLLDENINVPIEPRKGHILVASRDRPIGNRKVMEFGYLLSKFGGERQVDSELKKYGVALVFEPTESQNFLLGSSREFASMDSSVNYQVVKAIARRATRFYPILKDMLMIRSYAGHRPWTPDHLPIVSEVSGYSGFYVAAGHEGDGISLAAITGKLIQELIQGVKSSVPLEPLSIERFQKESVKG